jgi:hypothetical protein
MEWDLMYLGILGVRMAGVGGIHKAAKLKQSFVTREMKRWIRDPLWADCSIQRQTLCAQLDVQESISGPRILCKDETKEL